MVITKAVEDNIKEVLKHLKEKFDTDEKYDIIIADNQDDLIFLVGQRFRKDFKVQKNNTHKKWYRHAMANNLLNGVVIGNIYVNYDIYS